MDEKDLFAQLSGIADNVLIKRYWGVGEEEFKNLPRNMQECMKGTADKLSPGSVVDNSEPLSPDEAWSMMAKHQCPDTNFSIRGTDIRSSIFVCVGKTKRGSKLFLRVVVNKIPNTTFPPKMELQGVCLLRFKKGGKMFYQTAMGPCITPQGLVNDLIKQSEDLSSPMRKQVRADIINENLENFSNLEELQDDEESGEKPWWEK